MLLRPLKDGCKVMTDLSSSSLSPPSCSDKKGWLLASGSDDRSVRLWYWRRTSSDVDIALLWGHSHRPWRSCWSEDGQQLFTVGEDLRCLLWKIPHDLSAVSEPLKPAQEWTGHEGKNIWSVSQCSGTIATGGADGAIRFWQAASETSSTLYEALGKDIIASFRAWRDHLVLVQKNGDVFYRSAASKRLVKIATLAKPSTQVHICFTSFEGREPLALIASRQGDIALLQLNYNFNLTESCLGYNVMAMDVRIMRGVLYLAIFDRQLRAVVVLGMIKQALRFAVYATSPPIDTERNPTLLYWLDDNTFLLADTIASVWIYRLSPVFDESTTPHIKLVYSGRLLNRGIHCISPYTTSGSLCFSVGNQDQGATYQIIEKAGSYEVEPIGIDCLGQGRVSQILDTPHGRKYMCCTIARASIVDEAGNTLATVYPPSSMSQSLQVVQIPEGYSFYSMLTKSLHLQTYATPVPPIVQSGLHGKEIHCVALHQFDGASDTILAATGSEEGVLKISLVNPDSLAFKPLFRLRDATLEGAGAVGSVCWASTAAPDVALLFVTAAQGALYCLKVTLLTEERIRVWRYPSAPLLKAEEEISRIVALDVLQCDNETGTYNVLAGYADGIVKLWKFCQADNSWSMAWSSAWHDRCILSVKLCLVDNDLLALTGATDGRLAIWNLSRHSVKEPTSVLDRLHQSGVNVLNAQYTNAKLSVVSGGDDNSIAFESISMADSALARNSKTLRQLNAHASSVKGMAWLDESRFVTSSTDQRIIVWKVHADASKLEKVTSAMSHVADVGGLHALRLRDGLYIVSACGMGVEVFAIDA